LAITGEQVAARCKHGEMPPGGNTIAGVRSAIPRARSKQTERKRARDRETEREREREAEAMA